MKSRREQNRPVKISERLLQRITLTCGQGYAIRSKKSARASEYRSQQ